MGWEKRVLDDDGEFVEYRYEATHEEYMKKFLEEHTCGFHGYGEIKGENFFNIMKTEFKDG